MGLIGQEHKAAGLILSLERQFADRLDLDQAGMIPSYQAMPRGVSQNPNAFHLCHHWPRLGVHPSLSKRISRVPTSSIVLV